MAALSAQSTPLAGRNTNVGGGPTFINLNPFELMGDPNRAQNVEPDCDVDSRNSAVIVCSDVDYRLVDFAGVAGGVHLDSWNGIMQSRDGGTTWAGRLHPGHPLDPVDSPLKKYQYGFDPQIRFGAAGVMYHVGGVASRNGTSGAIYASTWVHLSDQEDELEPVRLANGTTKELVSTNSGQFQDRPSLAVGDQPNGRTCTSEIPRRDGTIATQVVPCTTAYVTYATFLSNKTKFFFTKTLNGGKGWTQPVFVSESNAIGQFAQIVKVPNSRRLLFFWRRAQTSPPQGQTSAIMLAVSNNDGDTWSKATVFRELCDFDQDTTPTRFRFRSMPQAAADGIGRVYVTWHERPRQGGQCAGPGGALADSRVFVATTDGVIHATPTMVDPHSGRGHQIFPTVAASAGKVHFAWMDFRNDASERFEPILDEANSLLNENPKLLEPKRHTADMYARQADISTTAVVNPAFGQAPPSFPLSRYTFGIPNVADEPRQQLQWNVVFARNFGQMRLPFHGDLNSNRGESIVPKNPVASPGVWTYNGAPGSPPRTPVFHSFWTDGRHLKLIAKEPYFDDNGNMVPRPYTPPNFAAQGIPTDKSLYDPLVNKPQCDPNNSFAGTKNLEIYTSRTTEGLYAFVPWNNKAMIKTSGQAIQRAFVVVVQNTVPARAGQPIDPTPYRLSIPPGATPGSIDASAGTTASWKQFGAPILTEDVFVAQGTAIARTLYVRNPNNARAAVRVLIEELELNAGVLQLKAGGRRTTLFVNPDPTAPLNPLRPGNVDQTAEAFDIGKFEVHDIELSKAEAQDINAPKVNGQGQPDGSTAWPTPGWENPGWENPGWENPGWENPGWENPGWENPGWENPGWENGSLADDVTGGSYRHVRSRYTSTANTTSAYDVRVVVNNAHKDLVFQLIAYKLYTTTGADSCFHSLVGNTQVLVNIPDYNVDPSNLNSPPPESPQNTTIYLHPGETVYTVLVAFDPTTPTFDANKLPLGSVLFAARPQAVNTALAEMIPPITTPPLVFNDSPFLTFTQGPTDALVDEDIEWIDGPVEVTAENDTGIRLPNVPVTISIASGPSGAQLSGTTTKITDAFGQATFDDLQIDTAGTYTLLASAPSVASVTSDSFEILNSSVVTVTSDTGTGSLRQAITDANSSVGPDRITFEIASAGPHTIAPASPFPTITSAVEIDGFTQAGSTFNTPMIVLNGDALPVEAIGVSGLTLSGGNSEVRGLVINGFPGPGISINSSGNTIRLNFIGTDAIGSTAVPNAQGIVILGGANNNLIGGDSFDRNVIGGNSEWGIGIQGNNNMVRGNIIGDVTELDGGDPTGAPNGSGVVGSPDSGAAVMLLGGAANNQISGLPDGSAGNFIWDNNTRGVVLSGGVVAGVGPAGSGNAIRFNHIEDNAGLGLDLGNDGITANDGPCFEGPPCPADSDTGPNGLQNTADLASAVLSGQLTVTGSLVSSPSTTFNVDYYFQANCDVESSTDRDGRTWFGTRAHTTDPTGNAVIADSFSPAPTDLFVNYSITVTVTNPGGSTSEFSQCRVVTTPPEP